MARFFYVTEVAVEGEEAVITVSNVFEKTAPMEALGEKIYLEIKKKKYMLSTQFHKGEMTARINLDTLAANVDNRGARTLKLYVKLRFGNVSVFVPVYWRKGMDGARLVFSHCFAYGIRLLDENRFCIANDPAVLGGMDWHRLLQELPVYCTEIREEKGNIIFRLQNSAGVPHLDGICGTCPVSGSRGKTGGRLGLKNLSGETDHWFPWREMGPGCMEYTILQQECSFFSRYVHADSMEWKWVCEYGGKTEELRMKGTADSLPWLPMDDCKVKIEVRDGKVLYAEMDNYLYLDYLGAGQDGKTLRFSFRRRPYPIAFCRLVMRKANGTDEYAMPMEVLEAGPEGEVYKAELSLEGTEAFQQGIYLLYADILDGAMEMQIPLRIITACEIRENTYLPERIPYAVIGKEYYDILLYVDSSRNLKANIRKKNVICRFCRIALREGHLLLVFDMYKSDYFAGTDCFFLERDGDRFLLSSTLEDKGDCLHVEVTAGIKEILQHYEWTTFRIGVSFHGGAGMAYLQNNFYMPPLKGRENFAFCEEFQEDGQRIRCFGDFDGISYAMGFSDDLRLFEMLQLSVEKDRLRCVFARDGKAGQAESFNEPVGLYLESNKDGAVYEQGIAYESPCWVCEIPFSYLPLAEYTVFLRLKDGGKSSVKEKEWSGHVLCSYGKRKWVRTQKDGSLVLSVQEYLLYENEAMRQEMEKQIGKAKENREKEPGHIWLVGELYGLSARDNGFAFFEYCMAHPKEDTLVYFISKEENPDAVRLKPYSSHVLTYDSREHIYYEELAEFYIVSHGIRDAMSSLYHNQMGTYKKPVFYLGHGVTALKRIGITNKSYGGNIKKICAASAFERDLLVREGMFLEEEVAAGGLARFDKLCSGRSADKHFIWIMPTWRDSLAGSKEKFLHSEFYAFYKGLLTNTVLRKALEEKGCKILFTLHIEFEKYKVFFMEMENERVHIADMHEYEISDLLNGCSMMVTDYSSIVFDVAYQNKPVLFSQFDRAQYEVERGSYVDLETELPGPAVENEEEAVGKIMEYLENGFLLEAEYCRKREKYFDFHDTDNCKRIYEAVISCREELANE